MFALSHARVRSYRMSHAHKQQSRMLNNENGSCCPAETYLLVFSTPQTAAAPFVDLKNTAVPKTSQSCWISYTLCGLGLFFFFFFLYLHLTAVLRVLLTDFKSRGENNYPHSLPEVRNFQESFRRRSTGQKAPGSHQRSCHLFHCVGVSPKIREHGGGGESVCERSPLTRCLCSCALAYESVPQNCKSSGRMPVYQILKNH